MVLMTPTTHSKHISVRDGKETLIDDYAQIQKKDRAGGNGKNIKCPECGHVQRTYHLAWSKASCHGCAQMIPKYNGWLIDQLDTWMTPR